MDPSRALQGKPWLALLPSLVLICLGERLSTPAPTLPEQGLRPAKGFVPDEATAKRIAEAVLIPIYGKPTVDREKPLSAHLEKGAWHVQGTPEGAKASEDVAGGSVIVRISKRDGRILFVSHGK